MRTLVKNTTSSKKPDCAPEEALVEMEMALAMTPNLPGWAIGSYGYVLYSLGRFEDAEKILADANASSPNLMFNRARLAAAQVDGGKLAAAKTTIFELLKVRPDYTIRAIRDAWPKLRQGDNSPFLEALRKAGLPE